MVANYKALFDINKPSMLNPKSTMSYSLTCKRSLAKCLKLLKMDVLRWPLLLCLLISFGLLAFALTETECAPTAGADETTMTPATALPQPPEEDNEMQNDSPMQTSTPSPIEIPFLKSSRCKLYSKNEPRSRAIRICGMRELGLPNSSGVLYWRPQVCRSSHCQCVATKEVLRREKRTTADNKTTLEFRHYRVFECA